MEEYIKHFASFREKEEKTGPFFNRLMSVAGVTRILMEVVFITEGRSGRTPVMTTDTTEMNENRSRRGNDASSEENEAKENRTRVGDFLYREGLQRESTLTLG